MAKIIVLCYHEDIHHTIVQGAFADKRALNKYMKDEGISLGGWGFQYYTAHKVELIKR